MKEWAIDWEGSFLIVFNKWHLGKFSKVDGYNKHFTVITFLIIPIIMYED